MALKRLNDKHREHIALKERQFLEEKHQLLRARESATWDIEERQIQDRHQLAKEQLKDIYFLQRLQVRIFVLSFFFFTHFSLVVAAMVISWIAWSSSSEALRKATGDANFSYRSYWDYMHIYSPNCTYLSLPFFHYLQ